MKKNFIFFTLILIVLCFCACGLTSESPEMNDSEASTRPSLLSSVIYEEDATVGTGEKEVNVTVQAVDKTYIFTILTDKAILGEALIESGLVEGEEGPYGLYITSVNGIQAIYEKDNSYWALSVDNEVSSLGVDSVEIEYGRVYGLVYTIM